MAFNPITPQARLGALQQRLQALRMQDRQVMGRGLIGPHPGKGGPVQPVAPSPQRLGDPGGFHPVGGQRFAPQTSRTTGQGQQGNLFEPTMRPAAPPFHPFVRPVPYAAPPNYHPPTYMGYGRTGY